MWVNSKEWEAIQKRLTDLERWKDSHSRDVVEGRNFTVYSTTDKTWVSTHCGPSFQVPVSQQIAVKTVVERILARLGMELVYISGTPAAVEMQKKAKAA